MTDHVILNSPIRNPNSIHRSNTGQGLDALNGNSPGKKNEVTHMKEWLKTSDRRCLCFSISWVPWKPKFQKSGWSNPKLGRLVVAQEMLQGFTDCLQQLYQQILCVVPENVHNCGGCRLNFPNPTRLCSFLQTENEGQTLRSPSEGFQIGHETSMWNHRSCHF